jgi:hypothetical protein
MNKVLSGLLTAKVSGSSATGGKFPVSEFLQEYIRRINESRIDILNPGSICFFYGFINNPFLISPWGGKVREGEIYLITTLTILFGTTIIFDGADVPVHLADRSSASIALMISSRGISEGRAILNLIFPLNDTGYSKISTLRYSSRTSGHGS